jgi:hypothetical protein
LAPGEEFLEVTVPGGVTLGVAQARSEQFTVTPAGLGVHHALGDSVDVRLGGQQRK